MAAIGRRNISIKQGPSPYNSLPRECPSHICQITCAKDWIRIRLADVRIPKPAPDGRVGVTFVQDHRSSNYAVVTRKTLVLKPASDGWRIVAVR